MNETKRLWRLYTDAADAAWDLNQAAVGLAVRIDKEARGHPCGVLLLHLYDVTEAAAQLAYHHAENLHNRYMEAL